MTAGEQAPLPTFSGDPLEERPSFASFTLDSVPTRLGIAGVYRLWSPDAVLYVGESGDIPRRLQEHRRTKKWFKEVTRVDLVVIPHTSPRLIAETLEILRLLPRHNRAIKLGISVLGAVYPLNWR